MNNEVYEGYDNKSVLDDDQQTIVEIPLETFVSPREDFDQRSVRTSIERQTSENNEAYTSVIYFMTGICMVTGLLLSLIYYLDSETPFSVSKTRFGNILLAMLYIFCIVLSSGVFGAFIGSILGLPLLLCSD